MRDLIVSLTEHSKGAAFAHHSTDGAHDDDTVKYPVLSANPLSKADTDALAAELDAVRDEVMADLGEKDAKHIRRIYASVVYAEMLGRGLMIVGSQLSSKRARTATWALGAASLSLSKILNNMELGHNVMHGQYDWMQDNHLNSRQFDWDNVCPAPLWKHSHNFMHHTYTNIVGRDHDVGYHLFRITEEQKWHPSARYNLLKVMLVALGFQWAVGFHDVQISIKEYADSPELPTIMQQKSRALFAKAGRQLGKDYVAMPLIAYALAGRRGAIYTATGNLTANMARNIWTWAVIFCGHFTEQAHIYTHLPEDESRGDWYVRQMLGSSNIRGSKLFHIMTGNLSHQIEHHLFPDMPANRYGSIAPKVEAICHKYGLNYNTGSFAHQFTEVMRRIHHFSKPPQTNTDAPTSSSDNLNDPKPKPISNRASRFYPQVSARRQRILDKLPLFLAQAVAYV